MVRVKKLESHGYATMVKNRVTSVLTQYKRVTNEQTDTLLIAVAHVHS